MKVVCISVSLDVPCGQRASELKVPGSKTLANGSFVWNILSAVTLIQNPSCLNAQNRCCERGKQQIKARLSKRTLLTSRVLSAMRLLSADRPEGSRRLSLNNQQRRAVWEQRRAVWECAIKPGGRRSACFGRYLHGHTPHSMNQPLE